MNPFDNHPFPEERDSEGHSFLSFPSQWSDLTEEENTSMVERYLDHGIGTIKKASILFIVGVGIITLFFLSLPFMRFILELSSWAYRNVGRIF